MEAISSSSATRRAMVCQGKNKEGFIGPFWPHGPLGTSPACYIYTACPLLLMGTMMPCWDLLFCWVCHRVSFLAMPHLQKSWLFPPNFVNLLRCIHRTPSDGSPIKISAVHHVPSILVRPFCEFGLPDMQLVHNRFSLMYGPCQMRSILDSYTWMIWQYHGFQVYQKLSPPC